jgi:DNA-binding CsgD family transcriptional regulator
MTELPPGGPNRRDASRALTARELEVLALIATGASNDEIARSLAIAPATVKSHLTRVYRKIGAANRVQATRHYLDTYLRADPAAPADTGTPPRTTAAPPDQIDEHLQALAYISSEARRLRQHLRGLRPDAAAPEAHD